MPKINPAKIRKKLKTAAARKAFDLVNAMNPKWVLTEEKNRTYLFPQVYTKPQGGRGASTHDFGKAGDLDQAVRNVSRTFVDLAKKEPTVFVTAPFDKRGDTFAYNPKTRAFEPFSKK